MGTISEEAQNYTPQQIGNIADLEVVRTDAQVHLKKYKENTPDEFEVSVITVDGEDYRVPNSVLKDLKAILEDNPELKAFKVKKTGQDKQTRYLVIPLS